MNRVTGLESSGVKVERFLHLIVEVLVPLREIELSKKFDDETIEKTFLYNSLFLNLRNTVQ